MDGKRLPQKLYVSCKSLQDFSFKCVHWCDLKANRTENLKKVASIVKDTRKSVL